MRRTFRELLNRAESQKRGHAKAQRQKMGQIYFAFTGLPWPRASTRLPMIRAT
jgi:hypothetical protein